MNIIPAISELRKATGERLRIPGGPYIGKLVGSVAFFPVQRSRHFFRLWQSWSLDARLTYALKGKADTIVFDDEESGQAWTTTLDSFLKNGRTTHNRTGMKLCLAERFWRPAEEPEDSDQLPLFDFGAAQHQGVRA